MPASQHSLPELVSRARALVVPGERRILGICGSPGAGKSTLAQHLGAALGGDAVVVGMDGFHLAQNQLTPAMRPIKGAPETFDPAGYVALLRRLRANVDETVYAPEFRRSLEEPVAGAVAVPRMVPLVITEGNYLLLHDGPWGEVRGLLDEAWSLSTEFETERLERLVARHIEFGATADEAAAKSYGSDQRNADLIDVVAERADLHFVVVDWTRH